MPSNRKPDLLIQALRLHQEGDLPAAERLYRQILQADPRHADALHLLGVLADQVGRGEIATDLISQAIAIKGGEPAFHGNLGVAFAGLGKLDEAIGAYRRALVLQPDDFRAASNLGVALAKRGLPERAALCGRRAVALRPDNADLHNNLGNALQDHGSFVEAEAAYRRALAETPDYAGAHYGLAMLLLRTGRFEEGWREYEWRWATDAFPSPRRSFLQPQWRGEDLQGRAILLHAEQGLGDTIQFSRYAPMVAERGGRVIIEAHASLLPLFAGMAGVAQIVAKGDSLPPFALHCPLVSLPHIFATTIDEIPAPLSWPAVGAEDGGDWEESLPNGRLRVGIAWQGNPAFAEDRDRSIPLRHFLPLAKLPGVRLVSLQTQYGLDQLADFRKNAEIVELGHRFHSFLDTAAVIRRLDLVITSCTAMAHLAGSLGCPVWVALKRVPHWVWLDRREDSPWYPSIRLFRQSKAGDWEAVFARMTFELKKEKGQ